MRAFALLGAFAGDRFAGFAARATGGAAAADFAGAGGVAAAIWRRLAPFPGPAYRSATLSA